MPGVERTADAQWHGSLKEGNGKINAASGVLKDVPYTFGTRFEQAPGTNPEELIAAAHAACFSMALANNLSKKEYQVHSIKTHAIVSMADAKITKIRLETRGRVDEISAESFKTMADETGRTCPVSVALSAVPIEVDAKLETGAKA
jgi:lipoyl-dependent peroxiredoxin